MAIVMVDHKSDLVEALNRYYHRDKGNAAYGDRIVWRHSTSDWLLDVDNSGTGGKHANFGGALTIQDSGLDADMLRLTTAVAIGTNPASVGAIRLANLVGIASRNAANSADVSLIKLNASDQIDAGAVGTRLNLLGTVVAPAIDPPTVNGQVTNGSQVKAFGFFRVSGGSVTLHDNWNVASVTYNGAGDYSVAIDRDFTTAQYAVVVTVEHTSLLIAQVNATKASTGFDIHVRTAGAVKTDPSGVGFACFGTLI